ncbi:hypothetical protein M8J77_006806 [Diaphorina citri]|nr:hypothetical protein M8J77_006806 [Diaphorina citri]
MSNDNKSSKLLDDLESAMLTTIETRKDYSTKIITNYSKTLDLRFETLKRTKFILEDVPSSLSEKSLKTDQNQNVLSLIKEPKKIKVSLINEMNEKKKEICEALQILELIDEVERKHQLPQTYQVG